MTTMIILTEPKTITTTPISLPNPILITDSENLIVAHLKEAVAGKQHLQVMMEQTLYR